MSAAAKATAYSYERVSSGQQVAGGGIGGIALPGHFGGD